MSAPRIAAPLIALSVAAMAGLGIGAEPTAPLRYRRVFVPEVEVDRAVRGLLPMRRDEFDRRIQLAQAATGDQRGASQVRIASAQYRARLEGSALVGGQAELAIVHDATGPALLDLDPVDFALDGARWSAASGRTVPLGIDPAGRLVCLVEEDGNLNLSWSLNGQRDERGDLLFQFRLPSCPLQELRLTLPEGWKVAAERAIVERLGTAATAAAPIAGLSDWKIEVAGGGEVSLRIGKQPAVPQADPLVLVKEHAAYTVERGTINVESSFDLDVLNQPLAQLVLACDPSLEIVGASRGETRLGWSPLGVVDGRRRIAINLSPPLLGATDAIRVTAVANWSGRSVNRLPRIQVENATWQEGRTTVTADGSLPLRVTAQGGCRASGFLAASPLRTTNVWQFQQFLAGSVVQVAPADSSPELLEQSATTLEFGPTQINGVYTAEISVAAGLQFELQAEIPRAWIVDSIEVQPADALADRTLANRTAPQPAGGSQVLKLSLKRPLAEGRPVRLVVRAHHRRPVNDDWPPGEFLSFVRLSDVRSARRLVSWQVTDPAAQLSLAGDDRLHRLDPAQLSPPELRLFDAPPTGMLFEVDQAAEALRGRLVRTSTHYQADVTIRATVDREEVREDWRLNCTPQDAAVGRLLVHCRPPTSELGQWRIAGEDPREITVRQLDSVPAATAESVFEITLVRPRSSPFVLTAEFRRRRSERQELPLVSLPATTSQTGRIEIHASPGLPLAIVTEGIQTGPFRGSDPDAATLRGSYRYDPGRVARLTWHIPTTGQALPLAWVESLDVSSRYSAHGKGLHVTTWLVRNAGHDRLVFRLPPQATDVQAQIANQPIVRLVAQGNPGEYSVPLPAVGRSKIGITFATRELPFGWQGSSLVRSPMPQCDLSVLARCWRVQLAPGLVLAQPRSTKALGATQRAELSAPDPDADIESGWTGYEIDLSAAPLPHLRIYRSAILTAWSWCLGLAVAAVVVRLGAGRFGSLAFTSGLVVAVLALLPSELGALPAGALVGLALGAAWLLLAPRQAQATLRGVELSSRSTASLLRPAAGAGVIVVAAVGASWGQPAALAPVARDEPVWRRVVIPVDDARQPVGEYVFLEPELYDALLTATERLRLATPDWLMVGAVYRPVVTTRDPDASLQVDEIAATLEVETFRAETVVELGFQRSEIHLVERRARLDGELIVPEWTGDGSKLRVLIRQTGKHRLELVFGAIPQKVAEREQLELTVPLFADNRIELPASTRRIQAATPRGSTIATDPPGSRTIHLGRIAKLVLNWPLGSDAADEPVRIEAEQLLVWTVRPGSVVAQGKLRFRPLGGTVRQIAVELDPRLRVLPPPAAGVVARQWVENAGSVNRLQVLLAEPTATEVTVSIAVLWAESSGIGNLTLPRVAVRADQVTRSWSGLALGGNVQWKSPPVARPGDPSSDDFSKAWSDPLEGLVFAIDDSLPNVPSLLTQPGEPRIAASEIVHCGVSMNSIGVQYSAKLSGLAPDAYQHELKISPGLQITSAQVFAGAAPVRADWLQAADGTVLITQHLAPVPEQELTLAGHLTLAPGQRSVAAPLIEYASATHRQRQLNVFRQADVRLSVAADPAAWSASDAVGLGQYQGGLGRLAAALHSLPNAPDRRPTITVEPNQPELSGHVLVRLVPNESEWNVEIDAVVEVQTGVLDALRFELPPALSLPLTITPAVEHEIVKLPGQTGQWLLVRPQRAIDQSVRLSIRGHLRPSATQVAALPAMFLRGTPRVRHLAALPVRASGRQFEWETSGLQAIDSASLPADLPPLPPGYELFEVVVPRPSAVAQVRSATTARPEVQLAEHHLRLAPDSQLLGNSQLHVLPRGANRVEVLVPPACRLIHVSIDDVPVQPVQRGAGRWRLPALSGENLQHIHLVYAAALTPGSGAGSGADFRPPWIDGASATQTRWDIEPSGWSELDRGAVRLPHLDPRQADGRLAGAILAIGIGLVASWIVARERTGSWMARQAPLWIALGGGGWLAAGVWPWLGWLPIGLAIWLSIRSSWPRSLDQPLSSVLRRTGHG